MSERRPLEWWEQRQLEQQSCRAEDWSKISITDQTDLSAIHDVHFTGYVSIGALDGRAGQDISYAKIEDCRIGDNVIIRHVGRHLRNCIIGNRVKIIDTGRVEFEPESTCGVGTEVEVLDETGSRPVTIFPGLSAQLAMLMAREPRWCANHLKPMIEDWLMHYVGTPKIGDDAEIMGCGSLLNVSVDREIKVIGTGSLSNGTLVNNAAPGRCLTFVGGRVHAENFIIEDGVADSGAIIRNCYIGQGAGVERGFSAHDSLFFANAQMENGEACALFAGPYTVSMHKASLLIGCQTSFMNAGSGSNQSNHMYKLGPVHWGILERGVKTSSDSYLMLGAKIGAFSLLMGQHKTHPDSSQFPFSYLFGDDRGATVVVPAVMLRSCGLLRDEKKWPTRDKRLKRKLPMHDRIIFDVLNPQTVDKMLSASEVIDNLLQRPADDDRYLRYRGMKFTRAALERARLLYELAIYKYLSIKLIGDFGDSPEEISATDIPDWVDVAGLLMRRDWLQRAMASESLKEMEGVFTDAYEQYPRLEQEWIRQRFPKRWHRSRVLIEEYAHEFDKMVDEDRHRYLEELQAQNDMLAL